MVLVEIACVTVTGATLSPCESLTLGSVGICERRQLSRCRSDAVANVEVVQNSSNPVDSTDLHERASPLEDSRGVMHDLGIAWGWLS
jgi:hypothetical protein